MTRRESIAAMLAAACGEADTTVDVLSPKKPLIVVVKCKRAITSARIDAMRETWGQISRGTPLECVPFVILDPDFELSIVEDPRG